MLGTDPLGRPILENTIYDPLTRRLAPNGQVVTDAFPNNVIPVNRFDPVSAKIQALIPSPINSGLVNNWIPQPATKNINALTTFKGDHNLSDKAKMSFYLSWRTASGGSIVPGFGQDGVPIPLSNSRNGALNSPTVRINYDRIFTPTTLLHVGVGFIRHLQPDVALNEVLQYDAPGKLGLVGGIVNDFAGGTPATGFPRINNIGSTFGGYDSNLGPTNANYYYMIKPTWVVSLSHVRSNHSYKFGAEWRKDAFTDRNVRGPQGIYNFSTAQTALPSTDGQNLSGGTTGFGYASFLLGGADSASVSTQQDPQFRKTAWGVYAQDSWKATRKITVDYGLRYDIQTALSELHNRISAFEPKVLNPSAGNLPGGLAYAGEGPGRIGGQFTN
ncbi:MAG: TonB-dependent receptor, partial [Bryobacteraceae bacterium]